MAFTRPTTDQVNFRSSKTGTHLLDTYLEACEKGNFTLPVLMSNLFDDTTGGLNPNAISFRVKPNDINNTFQARFGIYSDATSGWFDTNQFFLDKRVLTLGALLMNVWTWFSQGRKVLFALRHIQDQPS